MMIEIVATPPDAVLPESVQKAWVGLRLESSGQDTSNNLALSRDNPSYHGYCVHGLTALEVLRKKDPEAAMKVFTRNPGVQYDGSLIFATNCCRVVE